MLKAKKNGVQEVIVKVVEYDADLSGIESVKREYERLQGMTCSEYFVTVCDQYDLIDNRNESDSGCVPVKSFFVQEIEVCSGSLCEVIK